MKRDSVKAYVHVRRDTALPLYAAVRILDYPHQLRRYFINGPFLNQKTYKDIQISYSLKYKFRKKNFFYEKINGSIG